jgi:CBS domain-containing protein
MKVRDCMTADPVVVDPTTPLAECRRLMRECSIRNLPVVEDGKVVGLLTDAAAWGPQGAGDTAGDEMVRPQVVADPDDTLLDVLTRCTWSLQEAVLIARDGHLEGILTEHDAVALAAEVLPEHATVEDIASTSLVTVPAGEAAEKALKTAEQSFLRHLIVCDGSKLRGVISRRDLMAAAGHPEPMSAGELVQGPVQWTVGWETPQREAAAMMVKHHIGCLPVVDDDDPTIPQGVVSRTDIMRALMGTPEVLRQGAE